AGFARGVSQTQRPGESRVQFGRRRKLDPGFRRDDVVGGALFANHLGSAGVEPPTPALPTRGREKSGANPQCHSAWASKTFLRLAWQIAREPGGPTAGAGASAC